jgi:hypothetical protein
MADPKVWLPTTFGASSLLIVVPKFPRFILVDTHLARLMVSEYRRNHLHLLTARSASLLISLTHTWQLAFLGKIEPYFNRLFMFRDLLCSTFTPYTFGPLTLKISAFS